MKLNKIMKLVFIIVLIFIIQSIVLVNISKATLESNRADSNSSKTMNAAFEQCYEMRNSSSSLGNNNLDPHLANARDIGIALYLGLSSYGATTGSGSPTVRITNEKNPIVSGTNSAQKRSTTGNITGIFELGASNEFMAAITPTFVTYVDCDKLLDPNNSKYVSMVNREGVTKSEKIEGTKGMPYDEITRDSNYYFFENNAISYSADALQFFSGMNGRVGNGLKYNSYRYRPVIWNGR